ncbi:syntaxin-binding protein 1-like [Rhopalosiphum maidis]|uniref:syntaxin-binding protein 1-like n=1 Tax=Rhopalosiphum maidis TaxID=43146 RepID=UPI000F00BD6D|nr:syntaxin-binding protein 1-like [Rhopalosiphum maidis]
MYKNYQVMGLKEAAQSLFLEDVIQWSCTPKSPNKRINWCILVLDREGMQIVSSSCKMHDLYHEGITLVEDLLKVREPVNLDAVYFLTPTKKSIAALVNDFPKDGVTKYKAAHIFFTKGKVFYLNCHDSFQSCYNPLRMNVRLPDLEELAIRISNVCHALNEYPSVRYMNNSNNTNNVELAKLVLEKLKIIKDDNPRMGDGYGKLRSQLIIIDRSFDITSLILHELTFQAMAYDNFPIRNDVFTFNENKVQKHVFFDQRDKLWDNIRHLHISTAVTTLSEKLKKCVNSLRASAAAADTANGSSVGAMSNAFKVIPIQKKISSYGRNCIRRKDQIRY